MTTDAVSRPTAANQDEETIVRYTFGERINHWIGALSLYLPAGDGPRVLVALSVLAGRGCGRRSDREILASVVRIDLYGITLLDLRKSGTAT
jgi:hypothetical protein